MPFSRCQSLRQKASCPQRGPRSWLALEASEQRVKLRVMKCCLLNSWGSLISPPLSPLPAPAILSSVAGGNYLLPGLSPMSPTYSPHGAEGSLYSTDMVPILPGLCLAACEALSLQHCQPLTLVASATLAFLQGQEGTRFLTRSHELTWSTPHLEHPFS